MPARHDDVAALVQRAQTEALNSRHTGKVRQTYHAQAGAHVSKAQAVHDRLAADRNRNRTITNLATNGDNWISFNIAWTAKGVNANDVDQLIRYVAAVDDCVVYQVAIDTGAIVPVGDHA